MLVMHLLAVATLLGTACVASAQQINFGRGKITTVHRPGKVEERTLPASLVLEAAGSMHAASNSPCHRRQAAPSHSSSLKLQAMRRIWGRESPNGK